MPNSATVAKTGDGNSRRFWRQSPNWATIVASVDRPLVLLLEQQSTCTRQQQQQRSDDVGRRQSALSGTVSYITTSAATTADTDNCRRSVVVIVAAVRTLGNASTTDAQQRPKPVERLALNLIQAPHLSSTSHQHT